MRSKRKNNEPTFKEKMHVQRQKDISRDAKQRREGVKEHHYNGGER